MQYRHIQDLMDDLRCSYLKLARSLTGSCRISYLENHRKMMRLRYQDIHLDILLYLQPTSAGPLSMAEHEQSAQEFQFARRTRTRSRHPHPFLKYQPRSLIVVKRGRIERIKGTSVPTRILMEAKRLAGAPFLIELRLYIL